jgi:dihydroflavonol-4-reductase
MVTALITGGTGFIGAHIARVLIEQGHTARVLRRESSPLTALEGLTVEHAIGDVTDSASLDKAMIGCQWVFHVAAVADYWRADKTRLYDVNVGGTRKVLESAQRAGVQRVVFTSSGMAVGVRADGQPADETVPFNFDPKFSPYAHSKFLAEQEVDKAVAAGQQVVTLCPAVVIGPGDINQISGSLVIELARGGVPVIPPGSITLVDVRDVALAHVVAAQVGRSGEKYLLGSYNLSWQTMTKTTAKVIGVRSPWFVVPRLLVSPIAITVGLLRRIGVRMAMDSAQIRMSARDIQFDCHKAWRELGEPQIGLEQSLRDTYDWYVAHGVIKNG